MSRRKVEINTKHALYEEIRKLYRETDDARLKIRYLAMMEFLDDKTSLAVAESLRTSDSTVREWLKRYNIFGLDGLIPQKHKGLECKLNEEQLHEIYSVLQKSPRECGFNKNNWPMRVLKLWIEKQYGVTYTVSSLYDVVHRIGLSVQRPRKKSRNGDPENKNSLCRNLKTLLRMQMIIQSLYMKWSAFSNVLIGLVNARWRKMVFLLPVPAGKQLQCAIGH